jgi:hypothetical protein
MLLGMKWRSSQMTDKCMKEDEEGWIVRREVSNAAGGKANAQNESEYCDETVGLMDDERTTGDSRRRGWMG